MFPTFFISALQYLKKYWYIALIALAGGYLYWRSSRSLAAVFKLLDETKIQYDQEIKSLISEHTKAMEEKDKLLVDYENKVVQIQSEYDTAMKNLQVKNDKDIHQIIKDAKGDPKLLADELSKATGIPVLPVEIKK